MSFRINDENLFQKYKTIWTKIEDLKNIESKMNLLPSCLLTLCLYTKTNITFKYIQAIVLIKL